MQRKNQLNRLFGLVVLLLILFFIGRWYWRTLQDPVDPHDTQVKAFVIQKGESTSSIAQRLQKEGLIKSAWVFKLVLKDSGKSGQIQAGDFKLSSSMNMSGVIEALSKGATDVWVTLIEGLRNEEYAEKLNQVLGVKKEDFLKAAKGKQGYLWPDTYLINKDANVSDIVALLEKTFNKKYSIEMRSKIRNLGLSEEQGVILASIVEREARSDKARTQVASILLKRFKVGMGLNVDAGVQYGLGYQQSEKSWWKKSLTHDDLKIDSVYNSYLYKGLPPTPICNPGLASLNAVANADLNTPYLYYYHDSKGNSYYAESLEEHNENVAEHP